MNDEHCYRAVRSRDTRFDGWFFGAVTTTGGWPGPETARGRYADAAAHLPRRRVSC